MLAGKSGSVLKLAGAAAAGAATVGGMAFANDAVVPPPARNWGHQGFFGAFDAAAIRRGHIVYTNVCASCHSVEQLRYRNFVGVCYTEEEMKKIAAEQDVEDGPNDEGEMFERPGKLSDPLPKPYANEEAARAANGGAVPPDLSLIIKGRPGFEDYVFALITGYKEAPAGVSLREGLYYNPYFPGGAIAMPPQLMDGAVEYPDGTEPSASQMAKDVVTFLSWASEPDQDQRKLLGLKVMGTLLAMTAITAWYKRFRWSPLKTRKISY